MIDQKTLDGWKRGDGIPLAPDAAHEDVVLPLIAEVERLSAQPRVIAKVTGVDAAAVTADQLGGRIRELETEVERLRGLLREVEWGRARGAEGYCPWCHQVRPGEWAHKHWAADEIGHAPDCRLAAALKGEP